MLVLIVLFTVMSIQLFQRGFHFFTECQLLYSLLLFYSYMFFYIRLFITSILFTCILLPSFFHCFYFLNVCSFTFLNLCSFTFFIHWFYFICVCSFTFYLFIASILFMYILLPFIYWLLVFYSLCSFTFIYFLSFLYSLNRTDSYVYILNCYAYIYPRKFRPWR